jgi:hypothetical protein
VVADDQEGGEMISEGRDALLFGAAVRNVFAGHH